MKFTAPGRGSGLYAVAAFITRIFYNDDQDVSYILSFGGNKKKRKEIAGEKCCCGRLLLLQPNEISFFFRWPDVSWREEEIPTKSAAVPYK